MCACMSVRVCECEYIKKHAIKTAYHKTVAQCLG